MTNKEFDEILERTNAVVCNREWYERAVKALEQEPKYCDRNICISNEYNGIGCDECEVTKSQEKILEPCENCVSRQAVVQWLENATDDSIEHAIDSNLEFIPPVTPTRKKGKWIVEVWNNKEHHTCSNCQHLIDYEPCYHYCPMCGAEMESEE